MEDIVIIIAGVVAGFVSEIGGAGMLISLPMLLSIGLPPTIANGTNRINVIGLYGAAWVEYEHGHRKRLQGLWRLGIPLILGTIGGAMVATSLTGDASKWLIIGLSFAMVAFTVFTEVDNVEKVKRPINSAGKFLVMTGAGLYCGLVQSSMAYLMFFLLVRILTIDKTIAEKLKVTFAIIVAIVGLTIFALRGDVDWRVGAILFVSSAFGGWLGSKATEKYKTITIKHLILIFAILSLLYILYYIHLNHTIF